MGILESLVNFVQLQRNKFEEFEEAGKRMAGTDAYEQRRIRRRNVRLDRLTTVTLNKLC